MSGAQAEENRGLLHNSDLQHFPTRCVDTSSSSHHESSDRAKLSEEDTDDFLALNAD